MTAKITAPKGAQGRISFRFSEYGKEPGVCMNAPENDQSKAPDLIIADPAAAPFDCVMCRPREEYDGGFTIYHIMRGLCPWPYTYCESCLRGMTVSDQYSS